MTKVSVITLPFRKTHLIKPVFDAIISQTHKDLEILAVINDPQDGSKEIIQNNYPNVKILEPGFNSWFAGGNNIAIRNSTGEFIQLVNDDLFLEPNYIEEMLKAFGDPDVAAATGKILRYDFAKNEKLNIIDSTGITMSKSGRGRDRGQNQIDQGQFDSQTEVFGVSGAGSMYRRSALEKVKYCVSETNCIIVHGCPSRKEDLIDITRMNAKHWIPWLKQSLQTKGIKTFAPLMPEPWAPDYQAWKKEFEKLPINDNSILVGHSCACPFLVRWLGDTKRKVKKLILVAAAKIPAEDANEKVKDLYTFETDETIKDRVSEIVIFLGENEKERHKEGSKIYSKVLGARIEVIKNRGHFTFNDMGTTEFPELLAEVVRGQNCEYFDEDFKMYWEDADLSWRLNNVGFKNVYASNAIAFHGRTAGQSKGGYLHLWHFVKHHKKIQPFIRQWNYKNHILMYLKNAKFIHPLFIMREIAMFGYILIFEISTLKVMPELFRQIPKIWKKRKSRT